ncbi:MAG: hypothetical protein QM490_05810 [Candidatus Gracilibacteria bacterium]
MIKKLLVLSLLIIFNFSFVEISYGATRDVGNTDIKNTLLDFTDGDDNIVKSDSEDGLEVTAYIFKWIKNSMTSLIMLISVGVFLFIGIKLTLARGKPEEFKAAMMQMVYAIIGILLVSLAWAAVVLVAGINL